MSEETTKIDQGERKPQGAKLSGSADIKRLPAGSGFKGIFIANSLTKKFDKNGKAYWDMTVSDQSGQLSAKVWSDGQWRDCSAPALEASPSELSDKQRFALKGKSVGVTGKVSDFRGQPQYSFSAITLLDQDRFPVSKYLPSSDVPYPVLEQRLEELIEGCRPEVRSFLRAAFDGERGRKFRTLPAAVSNHHAYAHGLLEHSVCVAEGARALALGYAGAYPTLDVDLVIAGALLHDIGKTEAYVMSPIPEITVDGAVLDHIAIGYAIFTRMADEEELPPDLRRKLGHIILSHHGQKEFGSPVMPATPEALIVAAADDIDFKLFCWRDAVKDLPDENEISQHHFAAQRRFWRPAAVSGGADGDEE